MPAMARRAMLLLLLAGACTGFSEVRPGVFRSPQVTEDRLVRRIERHGIHSVLCLRGPSEPAAATARAALATRTAFFQVPISATRPPRPEALLELWRIAAEAPRPLLVHCRAGVDRTGFASALIVLHDTGDLAAARSQLALVPYGHLASGASGVLDRVLDRYEPHHGTMAFPDWVARIYAVEFAAGDH
jgi:protein tyrosine phosphatase (PTP) superfamily phosphohydrolase (DUF442 family)